MIRPPRRLQELHRTPSAVELALELGGGVEELSDALVAAAGYRALPLDVPTHVDSSLSLGDGLRAEGDPYTLVERTECLRPALARMSVRERQIIRMRFVDCLTQEQIGREFGVSQMQVSRLLPAIIRRLRDDLGTTLSAATA
jgi:RNA polymerase sigma-B factor